MPPYVTVALAQSPGALFWVQLRFFVLNRNPLYHSSRQAVAKELDFLSRAKAELAFGKRCQGDGSIQK